MAEALPTPCSICDESYTDERPSLELPCQHTFCKPCIAQLEVDDTRICPFCRKTWEENLINSATVTSLKIFKTKLESCEDKKEKEIDDIDHICEVHHLKVVLYCVDCSVSVCLTCVTSNHKTHVFEDFNKYSPSIADELERSVEIKLSELEATDSKANEDLSNIEKEMSILIQFEKQILGRKKERAVEKKNIQKIKKEIVTLRSNLTKIQVVARDIRLKKHPFTINKGQKMLAEASTDVAEVTPSQSSELENIARSYMVSA
jgi:hypothetical protein